MLMVDREGLIDKEEQRKQYDKALCLYREGKYKEVIDIVDAMYGWSPGELGYTDDLQLRSAFCVNQLQVY